MKTVRFHEYNDPDLVRYEDVQVPVPGPGEVRIRLVSTAFIDDFAVARHLLATGHRPPRGV